MRNDCCIRISKLLIMKTINGSEIGFEIKTFRLLHPRKIYGAVDLRRKVLTTTIITNTSITTNASAVTRTIGTSSSGTLASTWSTSAAGDGCSNTYGCGRETQPQLYLHLLRRSR